MNSIGEWLHWLEVDREGAWHRVSEALDGIILRGVTPVDLADARQLLLEELFLDGGLAHRADPGRALQVFLRGCMRNRVRRIRSCRTRNHVRASAIAGGRAGTDVEPPVPPAPVDGDAQIRMLTAPQEEAVLLLRSGMRVAAIARALAISRSSVYDRLRRALENLAPPAPREARYDWLSSWERLAFIDRLDRDDTKNADILVLRMTGASQAEIARRRGMTRGAVRKRLSRMRGSITTHPPQMSVERG